MAEGNVRMSGGIGMPAIGFGKPRFRTLKDITVAEVLIEYLVLEGVEYVFGVSGGTIVPFLEALRKNTRIRFIMSRHETGAAFMADTYARLTGRLGVCISTAGPGATNMLTGVACAHSDRIPLLAITGQPATHTTGKGAVQESTDFGVNTVDIYSKCCGFSTLVYDPVVFPQMITRGLRAALGEHRQAVHLSFPADVSAHVFPTYDFPESVSMYRVAYSGVDREPLKKATRLLLTHQKSALLIGDGAPAEAAPLLVELAETLSTPVITTPSGKGSFPESHPLSLGVFGFAGNPRSKRLLHEEKPDVLFVIGSRLCEMSTESWSPHLSPGQFLIQLDEDAQNIGLNFTVSVGIVGNVVTALKVLLNQIKETISADDEMRDRFHSMREKRYEDTKIFKRDTCGFLDPEGFVSDNIPLKPQRLMNDLSAALEQDAIIIADTGNAFAWCLHYLVINPPQRFLIPLSYASMGYGAAGVVGAALACPGRQVVTVTGDGSMLMNGSEVHTAAQYGISCAWIILNDGGWGMVDHGLRALTGRSFASRFPRVDFARLASTLGAKGFRVTRPGELVSALEQARTFAGPTVIDAIIDENEVPPFLERIQGIRKYAERN
jgi:acetolactate synthase-1/2/3 large subunit